jgi:hypothetical protein
MMSPRDIATRGPSAAGPSRAPSSVTNWIVSVKLPTSPLPSPDMARGRDPTVSSPSDRQRSTKYKPASQLDMQSQQSGRPRSGKR